MKIIYFKKKEIIFSRKQEYDSYLKLSYLLTKFQHKYTNDKIIIKPKIIVIMQVNAELLHIVYVI